MMKNWKGFNWNAALTASCVLVFSQAVLANPFEIGSTPIASVADRGVYERGVEVNHNDITPDQKADQFTLNLQQKHEALAWSLTEEEEKRYVFLMQNQSGVYYQGLRLSPVWILGLNARNDKEREYFAILAAEQERQRIAKNLAWNEAFTRATREINQGLPVIKPFNTAPFSPLNYSPVDWQENDVLNIYVSQNTPLKGSITTLMHAMREYPTLKLTIYFTDAENSTVLTRWAQNNNVDQNFIKKQRVQLKSVNQGNLTKWDLPYFELIRDGKRQTIPADRF